MYPIDRRKVVAMIYEQCSSLRKTAKLLQVCHTTISRWLKSPERLERQRKTSKIYKSEDIVQLLKLTIHNDPFISIRKLKFIIKDALNIDVSYELVRVAIKNLGFSKKKAHFYGNTPGSCNEISVPTTRAYKECSNRFITHKIDEFRSTIIDYETDRVLDKVVSRNWTTCNKENTIKFRFSKGCENKALRGLLWCGSTNNENSKFIDRDLNAAKNIYRCATATPRPSILCRKSNCSKLTQGHKIIRTLFY